MSARDRYKLCSPPSDPRGLELWMQHTAGFILFQDMREEAIKEIDSTLGADAQEAARKGIDEAFYCLMQIIDGVTGCVVNEQYELKIRTIVELADRETGEAISQVDLLSHGDGMCMGCHGWFEGDYGKSPIVEPKV